MNEFAMHDAAGEGDLERVRRLIEAGVPVDSLDLEGQTPLHRAARYGQYEVAILLINSKCDFDIKDRRGQTPLMLADDWNRTDIVNLLVLRGARILRPILDTREARLRLNAVDRRDGRTPLMWAASRGDEEGAALLIRAGADVNRSDVQKRTALHWAAQKGLTRVIQVLLEKEGLDLSPQDVDGNTPLHFTCWFFRREAIKQLLDAGADTMMKNNEGKTALNMGIRIGVLTHEAIRWFVQKGAFLDNCDYECISRNPFLKESVLKDVELCTQSVVNKFNRQSLPLALNSIAYFARRLPNVDKFKLGARHINEVENLVKCEVERNTFCNVVKVRPIALSALCVLSLITYQSGKKRAAALYFGHSPFKKSHN